MIKSMPGTVGRTAGTNTRSKKTRGLHHRHKRQNIEGKLDLLRVGGIRLLNLALECERLKKFQQIWKLKNNGLDRLQLSSGSGAQDS